MMNKKEPVGLKKLTSQPLALALAVLAFLLLAQTTPLAAQAADQLDLALTPEVALDSAATDDHTVIYYFGHDQLDADNNKIELANIMMPKQLEREIIGNDGAPMVLVPEGDFFYGSDNRRLSLLNFYMDKFEVTTAQYAKFLGSMEKTGQGTWQALVPLSDWQKPVVRVAWIEAEAYCRYYGQRLPSEQEWEKAARGTDGRKYPWGNDEPTRRHANFNNCCDFWNYDALFNVGSFEDGRSPYGIYDLAGNVYEWTSSDHHGRTKVVRGGAWMNAASSLQSSVRGWHFPGDSSDHDGFRCVQDAR
ncbi:MAG: formylglycine-generating enzyme family protein [Nitrospiraceae bacterium]